MRFEKIDLILIPPPRFGFTDMVNILNRELHCKLLPRTLKLIYQAAIVEQKRNICFIVGNDHFSIGALKLYSYL